MFERLADRYDAWYEGPAGRVAFPIEVDCLRPLLAGTLPPRLEVGVGSGRFAGAPGIEVGWIPRWPRLGLPGTGVFGWWVGRESACPSASAPSVPCCWW